MSDAWAWFVVIAVFLAACARNRYLDWAAVAFFLYGVCLIVLPSEYMSWANDLPKWLGSTSLMGFMLSLMYLVVRACAGAGGGNDSRGSGVDTGGGE